MNVTVLRMLSVKETKHLPKVSNVFVLHQAQKTEVKFVVAMVEHMLTHRFYKENLV